MDQDQAGIAASNIESPTAPVVPEQLPPKASSHMVWWGVGIALVAVVLVGAYLALPQYFGAKEEKVYHVGILNALDYFSPAIDGFKQRMTELGYVEGKNIVYDIQKAPAPVGNEAIVKKFVDDHVDLIFSFPTEASLEAKAGTVGTGIPVVSLAIATEGTNIVESVQKPGGNLTGVRFPIPETTAKRLEILHQIAPNAKRIFVPYLKDYPTVPAALGAIRTYAGTLGVTLVEAPFSTPDEVTAYIAAHPKPEIDALLTIPEPISILPPFMDQFIAYTDAHNIPVAGAVISETDSGAAFSLIPSGLDMGMLAAPLADKIFHGMDVGSLPIVTPEPVLEINYKVIQRMGLTASEGLLSTASRVVH